MGANTSWKDRIRAEIKAQKRSQRSVSLAAGLGHSSLRYLLTNADTLSLDTAQKLADTLGVSVKEILTGEKARVKADKDLGRVGVRLVGIREPVYRPTGDPEGFVAVPERLCPEITHAFRQHDSSMVDRGNNMPPDPETVVLKDDIVVWSPEKEPEAGKLAIVGDVGPHGRTGRLTVRTLSMESGRWQAIANDTSHGRQNLDIDFDVAGGVIAIVRDFN